MGWRKEPKRYPGIRPLFCPVAQLAERLALDQEVPGSNPGGATPALIFAQPPPRTSRTASWIHSRAQSPAHIA